MRWPGERGCCPSGPFELLRFFLEMWRGGLAASFPARRLVAECRVEAEQSTSRCEAAVPKHHRIMISAAALGRPPLLILSATLLSSSPSSSRAFHLAPGNPPTLLVPAIPAGTKSTAAAAAVRRYRARRHPRTFASTYWRAGGDIRRRQSQVGICLDGDDSCGTGNSDRELDPCVDIAAHYLVPVLFRDNDDEDDEDASAPQTIEAEKALKRCLRQCEKVWRDTESSNGDTTASRRMANLPSSGQTERQSSRKRLSDLVLGTSVMRMRHWYALSQRVGDTFALLDGNYLEPIVGVEPWMTKVGTSTSRANDDCCTDARMGIARDLVRLHAEYLLRSDAAADDEAGDSIHWPADTIQRIAVQQSLPSFIVRLLVDQYGAQEAEMLCQLANKPGPITLRRNFIKCDSDEALAQRLWEEDGIKSFVPCASTGAGTAGDESAMTPMPSGCVCLDFDGGSSASERPTKSLWSLQAWKDGWFEVQDVGSQIIVESVDIQQSDNKVVDFCAGNGGKTLALASKMWEVRQQCGKNSQAGTIIAHDIVESRLKQIQGSLTRAGLNGLEENDMGMVQNHIPTIQTTSNATSIGEGVADAVLVDAPCSSLGVLRRRPGHRWALKENMITQDFPSLQFDVTPCQTRGEINLCNLFHQSFRERGCC